MRIVDAWLGVAKSVARIVLGNDVKKVYEENKRLKEENRELREMVKVLKDDCNFAIAAANHISIACNNLRGRLGKPEKHVCKPGSAGKCCGL